MADKHGMIMAASSQSKNRALDKSKSSTKEILSTLIRDYSVDRNHIILCGFSGGGRAAYAIASEDSRVTGVISCGAGLLGQMNINLLKRISYMGISGVQDMNFSEQYFLHQRIANEGGRSKLITTDDGHDWPKLFHMEEAMYHLLQIPSIAEAKVFEDSIIRENVSKGNLYFALLHADNLYDEDWTTLSSFTGVTLAQMRQDSIEFVQVLKADEAYANNFFTDAQRSMLPMGSEMITNGFWDKKAREVKSRINSKDPYRAWSGQRQYDISWRYCAEFFLPTMEQDNYQSAFALAAIWNAFDPTSTIPFVMKAKASAAQGDRRQAMKMLDKAIKLGFSNKENLMRDPWLKEVLKEGDLDSLFEKRKR